MYICIEVEILLNLRDNFVKVDSSKFILLNSVVNNWVFEKCKEISTKLFYRL